MMDERMAGFEAEVTQLKTSLAVHEAGIEQQKENFADHMQREFANTKLVMHEIVEGAKK